MHLRINGRYRGVYVLMERAELSKRRVQGDALLELTEPAKLDDGDESFAAAGGLAVRHVEPDEADKKKARAARQAVRAFEAALGGPGWRVHLDEPSAVNFVLLAELLRNQEAFFEHLPAPARGGCSPSGPSGTSTSAPATPPTRRPGLAPGRPRLGGRAARRRRLPRGARRALARAARGRFRRGAAADRRRGAAALRTPARRNFDRWSMLGRALFAPAGHATTRPRYALKDWISRRAARPDAALA